MGLASISRPLPTTVAEDQTCGRVTAAEDYHPAWWLPGPHTQTLWAALATSPSLPLLQRERVELPDGDFLDLDHAGAPGGPCVMLLHGLEGGRDSPYVRALLGCIETLGWHGVLLNLRGCSGELNRLPRGYHSGDTADLAFVAALLRTRLGPLPLLGVGFSLGGNQLLKYLGETRDAALLDAAVAVSVPFELGRAADRLSRGFSRLYQRHLVGRLQEKVRRKSRALQGYPLAVERVAEWRDFRTFDDQVTAPLNGFRDADDYYARSSSRQFLRHIARPTLVLHAMDDPFLPPDAIPTEAELAASVTLELARRGGHVGFIEGATPWQASRWLEPRILRFLASCVE